MTLIARREFLQYLGAGAAMSIAGLDAACTLLQPVADAIKMAFKEDIMPRTADKVVFFFAPTISAVCAVTALSVIPFGPIVSTWSFS